MHVAGIVIIPEEIVEVLSIKDKKEEEGQENQKKKIEG